MVPDPRKSCGPYSPVDPFRPLAAQREHEQIRPVKLAAATDVHHDTVGIIALDSGGNVAGGTTTNGATFKIPGFVAQHVLP